MQNLEELIQEIEVLTEEWTQKLQNDVDGESAALEFYCKEIMPRLLPVLVERFKSTHGQEPNYDGLISLLGFAPDTVILSTQFVKPETLVVIHTEETKKFLDTVLHYSGISVSAFHHESFTEDPYIDIYKALEAALKRFPRGANVAIELTGGKKTMSAALATAAGLLDIDLMYIDYSEYMSKFRKPRPASTYIHLVGNPLKLPVDLFSEVDIERAVNFFNIGKFDVSEILFHQSSQRMANPRAAEVCAELSRMYMLWNSFDFQEAFQLSSSLFEKTLRFYDQISTILYFELEKLGKQINSLKALAEGCRESLLWNFFFTAERYQKNNQSDIAALLYYRTLESIFENSLKIISNEFNTESPEYSLLTEDVQGLTNKFLEVRKSVFKKDLEILSKELPYPISMCDSLCLLEALNHPIAEKISTGRVANIATIRNRSVYAHGIKPIDSSSVSAIQKLATDALNQYIEITESDSIDVLRDGFKFIELRIHKNLG
jgi:hypothetical protein